MSESLPRFLIEPQVICGCGSFMEIREWWTNAGEDLGALSVPHPNRAHPCGSCGELWMPDSGTPGHLMSYVAGVLVWTPA